MAIYSFTGSHAFLSSHWLCVVYLEGIPYPSAEHAYQAYKTLDLKARVPFQLGHSTMTPGQAKRAGRTLALRPDWDRSVRIRVMWDVLDAKFSIPELADLLVATYPQKLYEVNTWGDRFWGLVPVYEKGGLTYKGHNMLGHLLMVVRGEIIMKRREVVANVKGKI